MVSLVLLVLLKMSQILLNEAEVQEMHDCWRWFVGTRHIVVMVSVVDPIDPFAMTIDPKVQRAETQPL